MLAFKIFLGVLGAGFMGAIAWCCSLLDKHKNRLEELERRMELYEHLQDNYCAKTEKSSLRVSSLADAVDVLTNRLNMLYDHVSEQRDATALSVDNLIASRDALYNMLKDQQCSIDYLHTVNDMFAKEQLALEEKVEQTELDIQEEFRANDNAFHNRLTRVEEKLGMVQWVDLEDGEGVEMEPEEGEKQGTNVGFEAENVPENPE